MVEALGQPLEVATVEGADLLGAIRLAAIAAVVAWITVGEAVGEHEVDDRVAPVACDRLLGRFGAFEQQQTVTAGGGLQPDPAVADHRGGAGQGVTQGLAFAEDLADRQLHLAAIPGLAGRGGCHRSGGFDRQQTQGWRGAGLDDQPIATGLGHFVAVGAVSAKRLASKGRERHGLVAGLRHAQLQLAGRETELDVVTVAGQRIPAQRQRLVVQSGGQFGVSQGGERQGEAEQRQQGRQAVGTHREAPLCFFATFDRALPARYRRKPESPGVFRAAEPNDLRPASTPSVPPKGRMQMARQVPRMERLPEPKAGSGWNKKQEATRNAKHEH